MKLTEKMSYLQGLIDGLDIDSSTKEGKALLQMSEVMSEMVLYVEDLQSQVDELTELCDILDEDLGIVVVVLEPEEVQGRLLGDEGLQLPEHLCPAGGKLLLNLANRAVRHVLIARLGQELGRVLERGYVQHALQTVAAQHPRLPRTEKG